MDEWVICNQKTITKIVCFPSPRAPQDGEFFCVQYHSRQLQLSVMKLMNNTHKRKHNYSFLRTMDCTNSNWNFMSCVRMHYDMRALQAILWGTQFILEKEMGVLRSLFFVRSKIDGYCESVMYLVCFCVSECHFEKIELLCKSQKWYVILKKRSSTSNKKDTLCICWHFFQFRSVMLLLWLLVYIIGDATTVGKYLHGFVGVTIHLHNNRLRLIYNLVSLVAAYFLNGIHYFMWLHRCCLQFLPEHATLSTLRSNNNSTQPNQ